MHKNVHIEENRKNLIMQKVIITLALNSKR